MNLNSMYIYRNICIRVCIECIEICRSCSSCLPLKAHTKKPGPQKTTRRMLDIQQERVCEGVV